MSRAWTAGDFDVARAVAAPLGLSRTLAHALFGAALGSLSGAALAEDKDGLSPIDPASHALPVVMAATTPSPSPVPAVSILAAAPSVLVPATTETQARPPVRLPETASAEERSYGPARPGLGTPASTMAPGQVSVEIGLVDWERDDVAGTRSDTVALGSTTVRVGMTRTVEALVGWSPYTQVRVRDDTGAVDKASGVGDVTLGLKANLMSPDGSGLSAAVQTFAVLPVGRQPIGAGDWGAGVVVPVSYDLSKTVNIALTSEVDAATNSEGKGRHLSYSIIAGVGLALTSTVKLTGELSAARDNDPVEHLTQTFASVSVGWNAASNLQFDIGGVAGLNRNSPDFRLYGGIARRF